MSKKIKVYEWAATVADFKRSDPTSIVYLASPYSDRNPQLQIVRYKIAQLHVVRLAEAEIAVFSPIVYSHTLAVEAHLPGDFAYWRQFDLAMLRACDELWVLLVAGWNNSQGVHAEVQAANRLKMPIFHVLPGNNKANSPYARAIVQERRR